MGNKPSSVDLGSKKMMERLEKVLAGQNKIAMWEVLAVADLTPQDKPYYITFFYDDDTTETRGLGDEHKHVSVREFVDSEGNEAAIDAMSYDTLAKFKIAKTKAADALLEKAQALMAQKCYDEAASVAAQGLADVPDHDDLLKLAERADQKLAKIARNRAHAHSLAKAEEERQQEELRAHARGLAKAEKKRQKKQQRDATARSRARTAQSERQVQSRAMSEAVLRIQSEGVKSLTNSHICAILKELQLLSLVPTFAKLGITGSDIADCANSDIFAKCIPGVSMLEAKRTYRALTEYFGSVVIGCG